MTPLRRVVRIGQEDYGRRQEGVRRGVEMLEGGGGNRSQRLNEGTGGKEGGDGAWRETA